MRYLLLLTVLFTKTLFSQDENNYRFSVSYNYPEHNMKINVLVTRDSDSVFISLNTNAHDIRVAKSEDMVNLLTEMNLFFFKKKRKFWDKISNPRSYDSSQRFIFSYIKNNEANKLNTLFLYSGKLKRMKKYKKAIYFLENLERLVLKSCLSAITNS